MRLASCMLLLLMTGCTKHPANPVAGWDGLRPAAGPYSMRTPFPTVEPSKIWLDAERDVFVQGQVPNVDVFSGGMGPGGFRSITSFTLLLPDGTPAPRRCDARSRPVSSSGLGTLDFECQWPSRPGVYTVSVDPSRLGLSGATETLRLRVLNGPPKARSAPPGWTALSLASRLPSRVCAEGKAYLATKNGRDVTLTPDRSLPPSSIPLELAPRLSADHAKAAKYVFESDDGWLLLFDHGEFGGGLEWFPRARGSPHDVFVGDAGIEPQIPQNVNRALAIDGEVYVLQGVSHLGPGKGQFGKVWREHGHFTSHVIARFDSEPIDWLREADGQWLVATWEAIWRVSEVGHAALVARLPDIVGVPTSLARSDDGSLYVGARGGVLRLSPMWPDEPRYAADLLVPRERATACVITDQASQVADPSNGN